MKLTLVKQGEFLSSKCDFYMDESYKIFMSRTQIGYALKYKDPNGSIRKIHERNCLNFENKYVEVDPDKMGGSNGRYRNKEKAFLYNISGIFEICRHSKQSVANSFFEYVYSVLLDIQENGYYIATEKDEKWLGVRQKSKLERRNFTDEIQEFVEYAKQHGSSKPEMYYKHFTKLVNDKLGIPKGSKRDDLTQSQLMDIMALERVITMKLPKLITDDMDYHDVYKQIKKLISII